MDVGTAERRTRAGEETRGLETLPIWQERGESRSQSHFRGWRTGAVLGQYRRSPIRETLVLKRQLVGTLIAQDRMLRMKKSTAPFLVQASTPLLD